MPTSLARKIAAAKKEAAKARAGREFLSPQPPFLPAPPERSVWRAKRAVSSVQKRFGFRQTNAHKKIKNQNSKFRRDSSVVERFLGKKKVVGSIPSPGLNVWQKKFHLLNFSVRNVKE